MNKNIQSFSLNTESMCTTCSKQDTCPAVVTEQDTKIVRQCVNHDPMKDSIDYIYEKTEKV